MCVTYMLYADSAISTRDVCNGGLIKFYIIFCRQGFQNVDGVMLGQRRGRWPTSP